MTPTASNPGAPRKVLLATDLSARGDRALERAVAIAASQKAQLIIVHVFEELDESTLSYGRRAAPSWQRPPDVVAITKRRIRQGLRADLGDAVENATLLIEEGDPPEIIERIAESERVDLVITGIAGERLLCKPPRNSWQNCPTTATAAASSDSHREKPRALGLSAHRRPDRFFRPIRSRAPVGAAVFSDPDPVFASCVRGTLRKPGVRFAPACGKLQRGSRSGTQILFWVRSSCPRRTGANCSAGRTWLTTAVSQGIRTYARCGSGGAWNPWPWRRR